MLNETKLFIKLMTIRIKNNNNINKYDFSDGSVPKT